MSLTDPETVLNLSPSTLVVFVDDTGHEQFADCNHPVYGLGGCATLGCDLDAVIRRPWKAVRQAVAGNANATLHAAEFDASPDHIDVVVKFFRTQPFARLAAICSRTTDFAGIEPPERQAVRSVSLAFMKRIEHVAKWMAFTSIAVVFESSNRANALIEQEFVHHGFMLDDQPVPIEFCFMPKSAGEPALEVSDFIMHAVGRQVRHRIHRKTGLVPDFRAVFHDELDARRASFIDITSVVAEPTRPQPA